MTEFHASDTVGGYRLEARLGGGGFGTVWRARRASDNLLVALKLLPDTAAADDLRLRADVELLAASAAKSSDHVVQVLDGGIDPVPFVVMEFIYGISLAEELKQRQHLPQTEVIDIGLAIADALTAINAAGIVHRDVKPSNVMIDRTGIVKLTDFGIAKIAGLDAVTLTGQLPLSIAYAAPEVWEGRAEHRSDLYALAILLYQCLTGQLPFRGAYAELFYQHRSKEPDLAAIPPDTAPSLTELIRACLEKSPADRPTDAQACIALLHQAASEVTAPPATFQAQAREPEHFGPWLKLEPVSGQPWAWYCRHETNGEEAIVELHFADSVAYGEALQRAAAANHRLQPFGAERILSASRLLLRPNEAWTNPPAGAFQFWVAREARDVPKPPAQVPPRVALRAVESLISLIEMADEEGLPLNLDPKRLTLLSEGNLYLTHPGFPPPGREEPEKQALAFLRSLPLSREVRASLNRATTLDDARRALGMLTSVRQLEGAPETHDVPPLVLPGRERQERVRDARPEKPAAKPLPVLPLIAGAAMLGVVFAVIVLVLLAEGGNDNRQAGPTGSSAAVATEVPTPIVDPVVAACVALPLPSPISSAESTCQDRATYVFDPTCPRGQSCNRKTTGQTISLGINDRTVVFTDASGNLAVAREDGSEPVVIPNTSKAIQPAWSPNGRYLAFTVIAPVDVPPTPQASPGATPVPGAPPVAQGPFFSTQLQVIDVDRPGDRGVLLATNSAPNAPAWLQRYATSPQWSPDGKTLYFLSIPAGQAAGSIYGVEVPMRGDAIDFSQLRSGLPTTETTMPTHLVTLSLSGSDFGSQPSALGRFSVRNNGELFVQVCDGDRTRLSCGLGRWNGKASMLVAITRDRIVEPPDAGIDSFYAYVKEANGSAGVIRVGADGVALQTDIRLPPPDPPADGAWFAMKPQLAVTRHGDALLASTSAGMLGGIRLTDGASSAWRAGSAPVWYVAGPEGDPVALPPIVPYSTPVPEPTPTAVTATATPPVVAVRPMTMNLTIRRGASPVSGATVTAVFGNDECARGTTDAIGRVSLVAPGPGAPASCGRSDARYRFQVNGTLVEQTVMFSPQSFSSFDIALP